MRRPIIGLEVRPYPDGCDRNLVAIDSRRPCPYTIDVLEFERSLDAALMELARLCEREIGYRPARFLQFFQEKGGLGAVRLLLTKSDVSYGLEILWEHKRLDLSIEALVITPPWSGMFNEVELAAARRKLSDLQYYGKSFLDGRAF